MSNMPDRATIESAYAGSAPWKIDQPTDPQVALADRVVGRALDAGENALFFAARGLRVTGIVFEQEAIRRAKGEATERELTAEFLVKDSLTLGDLGERFASVIDSGLFHVFTDEQRARYVAGLAHVTEPGGVLFLLCFSDEEPGTSGPRRLQLQILYDAFADGWAVESVVPTPFGVNPESSVAFSEGGPRCWFAVIRRQRRSKE
jgi:SAM-dependent methyltransferase